MITKNSLASAVITGLLHTPLPQRWVRAKGLTPLKLKRQFFICYQGSHHEIDLIGFGWKIIEFQHSKIMTKLKFEIQLYIPLNQDILSGRTFLRKDWFEMTSQGWL